jgi:hypothetical protein
MTEAQDYGEDGWEDSQGEGLGIPSLFRFPTSWRLRSAPRILMCGTWAANFLLTSELSCTSPPPPWVSDALGIMCWLADSPSTVE